MIGNRGFVYICRRADGLRKVGWSVDVDRRARELTYQTRIEHTPERHWAMGDVGARAVESAVHRSLRTVRVEREVYRLSLRRLRDEVLAAMHDVEQYGAGIMACSYRRFMGDQI